MMGGNYGSGIIYARLGLEYHQMSYTWSKEPWTLTYEDRPIYGALVSYKKPSEIAISSGNLTWAGDVSAIMKREVKSYATMMGNDSANWDGYLAPAPLLAPNRYVFNSVSPKWSSLPEAIGRVREGESLAIDIFGAKGYAEVQIHGGQATVSNIEHLIIGKDTQLRDDQISRLKALGITWSREGEDTIH